jgi:hypothetical protein
MSWLAKLKELKEVNLPEEGEILQKLPSPPTPTLQKLQKEVLVVSVGSLLGTSENLSSDNSALKEIQEEDIKSEPILLPNPNNDGYVSNNPVRSLAWSAVEIDTFICRRHRFTEKRLDLDNAESIVETLLFRDREVDNRRLCLECVHLQGDAQRGWRCAKVRYGQGNNRSLLAAHPITRQAMVLPMEYVYQLQRCHGFQEVL